jgi:hypothetical protein
MYNLRTLGRAARAFGLKKEFKESVAILTSADQHKNFHIVILPDHCSPAL